MISLWYDGIIALILIRFGPYSHYKCYKMLCRIINSDIQHGNTIDIAEKRKMRSLKQVVECRYNAINITWPEAPKTDKLMVFLPNRKSERRN